MLDEYWFLNKIYILFVLRFRGNGDNGVEINIEVEDR